MSELKSPNVVHIGTRPAHTRTQGCNSSYNSSSNVNMEQSVRSVRSIYASDFCSPGGRLGRDNREQSVRSAKSEVIDVDRPRAVPVIHTANEFTDPSSAPDIKAFTILLCVWQLVMIVIYAVWVDYDDTTNMELYPYFRDTSIMVFFGFGFLMSFLRHHGFSSITWTLLFSVMSAEWGILLELIVLEVHDHGASFDQRRGIDITVILGGLFAAATVMISFGAVLGKVTPVQLAVLAIIEPMFFWLNIYICQFQIEAIDVGGGMYIHLFGAIFGLAITYWLRTTKSHMHEDESSVYVSDIFSLAGTLFLWILWPSFNAAIAPTDDGRMRAVINTFMSLCGSTVATIIWSRLLNPGNRIDVVHVQNSTLAGGVAMGVVGDLILFPATVIGCGFIAGSISTVGYVYLTPFLHRRYGIQDICGVVNLHGTPGLWASLVAVFSLIPISSGSVGEFPHNSSQPLYQLAATCVTVVIALLGGLLCGVFMKQIVTRFCKDSEMESDKMFRDCSYWETPLGFPQALLGVTPQIGSESADSNE
eukprot:CFRG2257T1